MSGEQDRKSGNLDVRAAARLARSEGAADQTISDSDQTLSDVDQTAAERDAGSARTDQAASDDDQARADGQRSLDVEKDTQAEAAYAASRLIRQAGTLSRLDSNMARKETSRRRLETATRRDANSADRDETARRGDIRATEVDRADDAIEQPVAAQMEKIRKHAADDRRRAAGDRERAARDRQDATEEIARLEAELETAHLDALTGAYRREMGELALQHEIERARRGDGSFVIAYVDVDGMKQVNDRDGHAAGDNVLKTLVWTMRSKLRPFDPIVRYGGDEFVAGLGGACIEEATERFDLVKDALCDEIGVGISVGLAELDRDETLEQLTARADALLLEAKAQRHD
jgi:diguanylate cyclase (GGDEF)-like protein